LPNLFGSGPLTAGYATSRPPLHGRILEIAASRCQWSTAFDVALDVGCGAGLSTRALASFANRNLGVEPVEAMLAWTRMTAPNAVFAVGSAEALPVGSNSIDLITAAGSLNYIDCDQFFPEARRALKARGLLVVYDFSQGKSFRTSSELDLWHAEFIRRYPAPTNEYWHDLNPEILESYDSGFHLTEHDYFEIGLVLEPEFYLSYAMTETNVAAAIERGASEGDIRDWCSESLAPVFGGEEREVLFRGYFACMACD